MAVNEKRRNHVTITGLILIILGIILLFEKLDIWDLSYFIFTYWPLALIAVGIKLIFFPKKKRSEMRFKKLASHNFAESIQSDGSAYVYESRLFGDIHRTITSQKFSGGKFSIVAGDVELDASGIHLSTGQNTLQVEAVFGDISVKIPENIPVLIRTQFVAGEVNLKGVQSDGLFSQRSFKSPDFDQATDKLVVSVSAVFGAIKVWSEEDE